MAPASDSDPLLTLNDVHAAYVKKEILRGVSLSVFGGEIVALLGGNGSGKSTVLKTISGLLRPTSGQVIYERRDVSGCPVYPRHQMGIGSLLQGGRVFPNLSVNENLHIAARHSHGSRGAEIRVGALFPQLKERANDRAGLLSGGQKQMLAIEMVLAQRPKLALLDEPTAALSSDMARFILRIISEYARTTGCAVLLVEQNVAEAKEVSTRCLCLAEGRVQELSKQ